MVTSQQEIEKQLQADVDKFSHSPYTGKVPVQKNILKLFKRAIMHLPPNSHKIDMNQVKFILSKKNADEFTNSDIREFIRVIPAVPLNKLYSFWERSSAIDSQIEFQQLIICYNAIEVSFQKTMARKRDALKNMGGIKHEPKRGMQVAK